MSIAATTETEDRGWRIEDRKIGPRRDSALNQDLIAEGGEEHKAFMCFVNFVEISPCPGKPEQSML